MLLQLNYTFKNNETTDVYLTLSECYIHNLFDKERVEVQYKTFNNELITIKCNEEEDLDSVVFNGTVIYQRSGA